MKFLFTGWMIITLCVSGMQISAQTTSCVFCDIATGKIQQTQVIFKDEHIVVFLSHAPENPGHVLIIPAAHTSYFTDIPDSTICYMMQLAKRVTGAIKSSGIKAEGFSIKTNVGKAAGQSVMHAHLHIIPRFEGENLNIQHVIWPAEELDAIASVIRQALNNE